MKGKKSPQQMFSWMNPKLEVRKTQKYGAGDFPIFSTGKKIYKKKNGDGFGVFTTKEIRKGEILFVMGGYILTIDDENKLKGVVSDKPIEISAEFSIGPRKPSDLPRMPQHYVNHSCDPNAGFRGQIFMVAIKKIPKDKEVVFDYGMVMQSNSKSSNGEFYFDCLCGSTLCRKKIKEDDWKIKKLQNRYDGYFQYFIQEKIDSKKTRNNII